MLLLTAAAFAQQPAAKTEQPQATGNAALHPRVKMDTSLGSITIELDGEKAPISTLNFLRYADEGFYNGTIFHRVIPTFMVQGGGYTPDMEEKRSGLHDPIKNEWKNGLKNAKGTIAMARTAAPDSATAQFYINVVNNDMLDQPRGGAAYAVFGKVVEGMDTVEKIKSAKRINHPKYPSGDEPVTPETAIIIKTVTPVGTVDKTMIEASIKAQQEAAAKAAAEAKANKGKVTAEAAKKVEEELKIKPVVTKSGLYIFTLKEGTGASPKPTDTVQVNYRGTLVNGKEFDSSYKRGPLTSPLKRLIPGWVEGVGTMKVGGKAKMVIPPELAYGEQDLGEIPPNSTLIFEIDLLAVTPPQ